MAGYNAIGEEERRHRLENWQRDLETELAQAEREERERIEAISEEIRRDGYTRGGRVGAAGALTALDQDGRTAFDGTRVISRVRLNELKMNNHVKFT